MIGTLGFHSLIEVFSSFPSTFINLITALSHFITGIIMCMYTRVYLQIVDLHKDPRGEGIFGHTKTMGRVPTTNFMESYNQQNGGTSNTSAIKLGRPCLENHQHDSLASGHREKNIRNEVRTFFSPLHIIFNSSFA